MALHSVQLSKGTAQEVKSVEQVKELVVLDLMMAVLLRLLSVQSGVTVSVLHINPVDLNVDLDFKQLIIEVNTLLNILLNEDHRGCTHVIRHVNM